MRQFGRNENQVLFLPPKINPGLQNKLWYKKCKLPIMLTKPEASALYSSAMFYPVKNYRREKKQSKQA